MDSFELNKIIGAILGTLLFVMGAGFIAEAVYHPVEGRGPGYELPEPVADADLGPVDDTPPVPIGTLLASANIDQGAQAARRCQGCHNFGEGEPHKQGPVLWETVGHPIGGHAGYAYSDILAAQGAEGETWTYENLNAFLLAPRGFAPGTKMNFAGLRNDAERANVIAYLSTLSNNPVPFPPPEPEAAATAETELPAGAEPVSDAAPSVEGETAVEPEVVQTPTETQTDTGVEGTPVRPAVPEAAPTDEDEAGEAEEATAQP